MWTYPLARAVCLIGLLVMVAVIGRYALDATAHHDEYQYFTAAMLWPDLEPYAEPKQNRVMEEHLAHYRAVLNLRREHSALRVGTYETLLVDDDEVPRDSVDPPPWGETPWTGLHEVEVLVAGDGAGPDSLVGRPLVHAHGRRA